MSYVLELSGVISYTDNDKRSFLAVDDIKDDIKDDIIIQDPQTFGDVDSAFRNLMLRAGGELALPRTTPKSSKSPRISNLKISCWYTIGEESYEFAVQRSDTTGLITTGDGSIAQFMANYERGANNFINRVIRGATLRGVTPAQPVLMFLKNDVLTTAEIIIGLYRQPNPGVFELIIEKRIDPNNEAAVIFDRAGFNAPFVHARVAGSPPPQPVGINTQVNLLGILQVDLVVAPNLNISLTNPIFA